MCKKLIYLFCFVLALGLVLTSVANAADPSLVGWWKLDDGSGITASDSSGNENHGTVFRVPLWEAGKIGGALHFNGSSNYVQIPFSESLRVLNRGDLTFTAWFNLDVINKKQIILQQMWLNGPGRTWLWPDADNEIKSFLGGVATLSGIRVEALTWYHAAVVVTEGGATDSVQMYVNGALAGNPVQTGMENCEGDFLIGVMWDIGRDFMDGPIDDVRIYSRALTEAEIQMAMMGIVPLASGPSPDDEVTDVPREVVLNWTPGEFAGQHDVYFGTSFDDVNDATNLDPMGPDNIYRAREGVNSYAVPERLDLEQTYYWRIDEVNAPPDSTIFKGDVWQFTAELIAYPIENVTATASSADSSGVGPENTINDSGLDDSGLLHGKISIGNMWLSSFTGAQPTWIQYEFDKVYKLHEMWVWNHNTAFEFIVGFGLKDVSIEYSTNGADWKALGGVPEFAQAPGADGYTHNTTVDLGGVAAKYVRLMVNSNWGGLYSQYGLSEVRFLYIPVWAREPNPASGTANVPLDATLGFRAGREAAKHGVHLSTDEQAVIDGTVPVATVTDSSYASSLDLASTYYWRVDEVNDVETPTTWQGDIWNLSTQEYLVVEDFESYNDIEAGQEGSNLVYVVWKDGFDNPTTNGSAMGYTVPFEPTMETSIVHDGSQSVPLFYDNTVATYSEVTATLAGLQVGQDWTRHGIKALTLHFFGDPTNAVQQMYVKINGAKVPYDGSAADTTLAGWQMWYIDLADFGVNLSNVTELSIGFERSGAVGGKGVVYFDDIRLSHYDRQLVTPAEPDTAGLLAHWPLDEGSGTTVRDATGNGYDGTFQGDPQWVAGKLGGALQFDGIDDYVIHTLPEARNYDSFTVALWVRAATLGQDQFISLFSSHTPNSSGIQIDVDGTNPGVYRTNPGIWNHFGPVTVEWVHLVLVGEGTTVQYYYNGIWATSGTLTENDLLFNEFIIGVSRNNANHFAGTIDEFRVYDRALTPDEVAWLAGRTTPFDKPF